MEIPVSYYLFVAALHNFCLGNQIDDNIDEKPPKEQKEWIHNKYEKDNCEIITHI